MNRVLNKETLKTLEFHKIVQSINQYTSSELGQSLLQQMKPSTDPTEIEEKISELNEFVELMRLNYSFHIQGIYKIKPYVQRAYIGSMLSPNELNEIKSHALVAKRMHKQLQQMIKDDVDIPIIASKFKYYPEIHDLLSALKSSIDQDIILDSASSELGRLRNSLKKEQARVKDTLQSMIRNQTTQKKLSESIVTVRNERYCIPVKSEHRHDFGGIVHDESASGQTVYVEPKAIVNMNNNIRQIEHHIKQEEDRILYELSSKVAEHKYALDFLEDIMGHLDFLISKARYCTSIQATKPTISETNRIFLPSAKHPLIDPSKVVRNTITKEDEHQAIVITGPNTGGKTVTLKTIGLLIIMHQSGLFIPTLDGAELPIYRQLFSDIGDEQSIEQSLSTFSSHMVNIVNMLNNANDETLLLFDELSAGTDPTEGAALAMSIIDYALGLGSTIIATTHYPELKVYGYNEPRVVNASVEFDVESLKPTYKLLLGVPGKSNAFLISKRLGLKNEIIDHAKSQIGQNDQQVNNMIDSLEHHASLAERQYSESTLLYKEAKEMHQTLQSEFDQFKRSKEKMLDEAKREANEIIKSAKKESKQIISDLRTLREIGASDIKDHELIEMQNELDQLKQQDIDIIKQKKHKAKETSKPKPLKIGDTVNVLTYGQKGEVIDIPNDEEVAVQMGIIKMKVKKEDVEKIKASKQPQVKVHTTKNHDRVKNELDLRGARYEEAIQQVDQYLDQALLSAYNEVYIIHGKGTGALQKGISEFLKTHRSVKSFRGGRPNEGGFGVTVVELK